MKLAQLKDYFAQRASIEEAIAASINASPNPNEPKAQKDGEFLSWMVPKSYLTLMLLVVIGSTALGIKYIIAGRTLMGIVEFCMTFIVVIGGVTSNRFRQRADQILSLALIGLWLCVTTLTITQGSLESTAMPWIILFGPIAHLIGLYRTGWVLSVLGALAILAIGTLEHLSMLPAPMEITPISRIVSTAIVIIAMSHVTILSRQWQQIATEKQTKEREFLIDKNQKKVELITNVNHELRTPLNALLSTIDAMSDEEIENGVRMQLSEQAAATTRHLLSVINDFLDSDKVLTNEEGIHVHRAEFSIRKCIRDIESIFKQYNEDSDTKLSFTVDEACPDFWIGAEGKLRQVLVNLIANSIHHAPGSAVHILVKPCSNKHLHVQFTDNGPGIPPDVYKRVYEEKKRVSKENTKAGRSGLGLPITIKLVEQYMGGEFLLKSTPSGVFIDINLPFIIVKQIAPKSYSDTQTQPVQNSLQADEVLKKEDFVNSKPNGKLFSDISILLIEDDKSSRNVLEYLFKKSGANVKLAASSAEAHELILYQYFDVILMDLHLDSTPTDQQESIDGYRLTHEAVSMNQGIVIGFTGNNSAKVRQDWIEKFGAKDVLAKPMNFEKLSQAILKNLAPPK